MSAILARKLSHQELLVLTKFKKLSQQEPNDGDVCKWYLIEREYSMNGIGKWNSEFKSFRCSSEEIVFLNPGATYWEKE